MLRLILFTFTLSALAAAQSTSPATAFVTGSGYTAPPSIYVAPGQIATFFVGGLPQTADGIASLSATVSGATGALGVIAATPVDSSTLAITIQVPFSLSSATVPLPNLAPFTTLSFCEQAVCTDPLNVLLTPAIPHIISTCDLFYSNAVAPNCQLAIYHQNGQYVSNTAPAASGEVLTLWALGLGAPSTGFPANSTAPIAMNDIVLQSEYPGSNPQLNTLSYEFAGLPVPTVGVYQINFAVPAPPAGLAPCGAPPPFPGIVTDGTQNGNLSISVGRNITFSGTAGTSGFGTGTIYLQSICVATS